MWLAGFRIAFKNLQRNSKRNYATLATILFGTAGIILFWGYFTRVELFLHAFSVYLNHVGDVSIYPKDGFAKHLSKPKKYSFSKETIEKITALASKDERIASLYPLLSASAMAGNGCKSVPVIITGIVPEAEKMARTNAFVRTYANDFVPMLKGQTLWEASSTLASPMIVTEEVANKLGKKIVLSEASPSAQDTSSQVLDCETDPNVEKTIAADANIQLAGMTMDGQLSALDGEIAGWKRGTLTWTANTEMETSLANLQRLLDTDRASNILLYLKDANQAQAVADSLKKNLPALGIEADVYTYKDEVVNSFYVGTLNVLATMAVFFLILISFASVTSTAGSMTMTVLERAKEIGYMRAMGYTPKEICILLSQEGFYISFIGVLLGIGAALTFSYIISQFHIQLAPPGMVGTVRFLLELNVGTISLIALFMLLVALITCIVTTYRFAKKDLEELLTQTIL